MQHVASPQIARQFAAAPHLPDVMFDFIARTIFHLALIEEANRIFLLGADQAKILDATEAVPELPLLK